MSAGHRHWTIRLPAESARLHLLRTPLSRTADPARAEASRWVWGMEWEQVAGNGPIRNVPVYVLTPLGILHTLTGLTIDSRPKA